MFGKAASLGAAPASVEMLDRAPEFGQNDLADNQLVFGQDRAEHVCAEPARGDRGDQHIGVETDPHETARNTSSSVR